MQRWCSKLRSLSTISSSRPSHPLPWRILRLHSPASPASRPAFPLSSVIPPAAVLLPGHLSSPNSKSIAVQVRNYSKENKWKKLTPTISKVKKIKIKGYSSYKRRFRLLSDGTIRRWRQGKRHNAHLKSKISKRRLRKPSTVPLAYAKVMKKLHFCAT